jgi:hypothetical protein
MKRLGLLVAAAAIVALGASDVTAQGKSGAAKGASVNAGAGRSTGGGPKNTAGSPKADAPKGPRATSPIVTPPNRIATRIGGNPQQKARVAAMLPAGMTIEEATAGFRNQGQFMAALNASKNQGVDFAALQTAMTVDGLSLGQAVKQLRTAPVTTPTTTQTTTPATGTTTGTTPTPAS